MKTIDEVVSEYIEDAKNCINNHKDYEPRLVYMFKLKATGRQEIIGEKVGRFFRDEVTKQLFPFVVRSVALDMAKKFNADLEAIILLSEAYISTYKQDEMPDKPPMPRDDPKAEEVLMINITTKDSVTLRTILQVKKEGRIVDFKDLNTDDVVSTKGRFTSFFPEELKAPAVV